jgi:hypothetical protein
MHLIVVRRDMTGFQHLHPTLSEDGTWTSPITIDDAGSYRVFADFKRDGTNHTLAADLAVDGGTDWQQLAAPKPADTTADGYEVELEGGEPVAGEEAELEFSITRDGEPVEVEPYLGADGHLVALREGDLAYLHVHPVEGAEHEEDRGAEHAEAGGAGEPIAFATEFPSAGRYGLFLQFRADGEVHTAAFTEDVTG